MSRYQNTKNNVRLVQEGDGVSAAIAKQGAKQLAKRFAKMIAKLALRSKNFWIKKSPQIIKFAKRTKIGGRAVSKLGQSIGVPPEAQATIDLAISSKGFGQEGDGFFGDVYDFATAPIRVVAKGVGTVANATGGIVGDSINAVAAGARAMGEITNLPINLVRDIVEGKNLKDSVIARAENIGKDSLKLIAAPIKTIHAVTDPLGITPAADFLLDFVPGVGGLVLTASVLAELAEGILELKKLEAEAIKAAEKMEANVNKILDSLSDDPTFKYSPPTVIRKFASDLISSDAIKKLSGKKKADAFEAFLSERFLNGANDKDVSDILSDYKKRKLI